MLTPSGALLLPALQQNAAAAVAAFAAAAAAAAASQQQQQQQQQVPGSSAAFAMVGSPVMMAPFQRSRLKVARENNPETTSVSLLSLVPCFPSSAGLALFWWVEKVQFPARRLDEDLMDRSIVGFHEEWDNVGSKSR